MFYTIKSEHTKIEKKSDGFAFLIHKTGNLRTKQRTNIQQLKKNKLE